MTTTIMTRPRSGLEALDATDAHRQLGELLTSMVRAADARVEPGRRARRTVQEMVPGYERQPVLTLFRPVMAGDACPLCGRWSCDPSNCPPASAAPAPAATGSGNQCSSCGGWFGVIAAVPVPATAWTCDACQALGR
ncbi:MULTISPECIES: hypothetical protein [Streptomyces]|uniref:hypothetical protein n=1 Tax=Streptomyces TaxID=1883 RepID=UPI00210A78D8|nr:MULTISPECIES: hypothetical protein [Streptomyces]UUA11603.1 hypothetical protein NNW98_38995 [Streptomyces koelreuteriae]UUA19192.1 hypothetical protein NNW99_38820 [Streptomyces sp. CRCS-T-1]